jgi:hypothetical protein
MKNPGRWPWDGDIQQQRIYDKTRYEGSRMATQLVSNTPAKRATSPATDRTHENNYI